GNGRLGMPKDKPGLAEFASAVIAGGGIGEHSADDLQRIFAGKNIGFGFSVGEDAFNLSGRTTPEDLPLQLEAMTAQILQPGYQPEGVTQFRKGVPMLYQQLKHTSAGPMQELSSWLMSDDPRFEFPEDPDTLLAYTLNDARSWLADAFSKAPIELSIAGDFDHETIVPELLRTFGAIEVRTESAPLPDGAREVAFPETPQEKALDYESKIPKGIARVYWQVVGPRGNEEEFRRLQLLGTILSDRLRKEIREKLGASYSPGAGAGGSMAFDNFGYLTTLCEGKPEDLDKLVETCLELASDLAENGASEDELDRARKPALANIDKSLRSNSYWLGTVLAGSQDFARRIELAKSRRPDLEAITLEEINRLAAKYLGPDNAIQVTIESKAPTETDE
ncbi:MAG: insulinase family protein, partial [Verrucomicrobiota bacterium]